MPTRHIHVDGCDWQVYPSGFLTQSMADELGLLFVTGRGSARVVRVTRYCPERTRAREQALAELDDAALATLFHESQSSAYAPETGYRP